MSPGGQARDLAEVLARARHAARAVPGRPAFTFYRAGKRTARLSWYGFVAAIERAACALAERHGVKRGQRVAVLMANNERTPIVVLAIMALGAVAVPLNPTLEPEDWRFVALDSGSMGVVVADELRSKVELLEHALSFVCNDQELCAHVPSGPVPYGHDLAHEPAVILYTSGTTGQPKGVVLSHANLLANGRSMARHFGLHGQAQLAVMPLYHAHALGFGLMTMLASHGHLVLTEGLNAFHWAEIIRVERVHATSLVPTLLPFLLKLRVHALHLPSLKALLVSSAPLSQQLARDFIAGTDIPLVQGWGLSEYTNFATCGDADDGVEASRRQLLTGEWPSIGRPLPGVQMQVRDADGRVLAAGARGELFVRGPSRMLGYFRRGEPPRLQGDWLATGDEGYFDVDERGPLYFITGRIKDLIIRDAEKLSPLAIERRLLQGCPQLLGRVAVVGFTHALHGEEIGAYVETPDGGGELVERLLRCAQELPNGVRPKVVLCGTHPIPRTNTGKVQRARLKTLFDAYATCSGPTVMERAP